MDFAQFYSPITVTLLDTLTGQRVPVTWPDNLTDWDWSEGNWSCDCNRAIAFHDVMQTYIPPSTCVGARRFLVVEASDGRPGDYNLDYPAELRAKWGV